jgi:hypothetical protein
MSVTVVSPIKLIAESLSALLETYGYQVGSEVTRDTRLVLMDLTHEDSPRANPYKVPTVALVNYATKPTDILGLGYVAGVGVNQKSIKLRETIDAALNVLQPVS